MLIGSTDLMLKVFFAGSQDVCNTIAQFLTRFGISHSEPRKKGPAITDHVVIASTTKFHMNQVVKRADLSNLKLVIVFGLGKSAYRILR